MFTLPHNCVCCISEFLFRNDSIANHVDGVVEKFISELRGVVGVNELVGINELFLSRV